MPFVPSIAISGLDSLIEQYGRDSAALLSEAGIDPKILTRPDFPVDGQIFVDLLELVARKLNQRFLGLQLAALQGATVLGSLWFLLRNSATIQEIIDSLLINYPSHTDVSFFSAERDKKGLTLIYEINPDIKGDNTQAVELGLGIGCLSLRRNIGSDWRPKAVYFKVSQPYDLTPYKQVFGESVYFEQDINGIYFTNEELRLPFTDVSSLQKNFFELKQKQHGDLNPRSTLVQVEHIIHSSLVRHNCSLGFVAKCLNVKPRTLQYHLKQQGTSFSSLLKKLN